MPVKTHGRAGFYNLPSVKPKSNPAASWGARTSVALLLWSLVAVSAASPSPSWPDVTLLSLKKVELHGALSDSLRRGVARLAEEPFTVDWLLADVSFKRNRIFTNYSGDASGRFIELAALTSPRGKMSPAALSPVLAAVADYQKPDGHFGLEVDLTKPLPKLATPIPMLWGNARLLVGLVTAAQEYNDPMLLAAARRLGDFYVNSAEQLCSPSREADYKSSGTYGDGYQCCYFPAIESLALLYCATKEERYLAHARRMADFFQKFDVLPVEHSHGNLCAWRGILELHAITGERAYLDRAIAKWEAAVKGGYVWPGGGIGEHWAVFFPGDEGCSHSDWLRFNLDLWRFTGETRYLDMAERLLHNQYLANQCANGGYGWRNFDGDACGPIATRGSVDEWPFCCSFHGPLGLHFLKGYLAAGSERGIFVNFPLDFTAPVKASGREWQLAVKSTRDLRQRLGTVAIELAPRDSAKPARTTVWLRVPPWVTNVRVVSGAGRKRRAPIEHGYLRVEREFKAGEKILVTFRTRLSVEARRFEPVKLSFAKTARLRDVSLLAGPAVLYALPAAGTGRTTLLATADNSGQLDLFRDAEGGFASVTLPSLDATDAQITSALESVRPVALRSWSELNTRRRAAFVHDVLVVPRDALPAPALARFTARTTEAEVAIRGPFFGTDLEKTPELWLGASGWEFKPEGLRVSGGDIGLIDGKGYRDYRFEFELVLSKDGQGLAGWVVRAKDASECLMFQIQSADSPFTAPEFKTQPNTLRPHVRRNGQWHIAEPVPLPKDVRRGEAHRIGVECRGERVEVFLDGERIHTQGALGLRDGAVGFRAAGAAEQGLFRKISLTKL